MGGTGTWRGIYWDIELHCDTKRGCTKTFVGGCAVKKGCNEI